jgi:hypothetical protein
MVDIPTKVFSLYKDFADSMITEFGVDCRLTYHKKIVTTATAVPAVKKSKSMRTYNKSQDFLQTDNYTTTETTETIKLRVYWTPKDFRAIAGNLVIPEDGIMTIGYISDLPKINSCEYLTPNIENEAYLGSKFTRINNPIPWGILKDRYFVCGWKQE